MPYCSLLRSYTTLKETLNCNLVEKPKYQSAIVIKWWYNLCSTLLSNGKVLPVLNSLVHLADLLIKRKYTNISVQISTYNDKIAWECVVAFCLTALKCYINILQATNFKNLISEYKHKKLHNKHILICDCMIKLTHFHSKHPMFMMLMTPINAMNISVLDGWSYLFIQAI